MSFPRYPKYKESGVEWLGQVPEHSCQRANGPLQPQPRATPWGNGRKGRLALKGRPNQHRVIGSPLQGSAHNRPHTQGVALGWVRSGLWPSGCGHRALGGQP
jgi:hypothetical protein